MRRTAFLLALALVVPVAATAGERDLLWRVVQTCIAAHRYAGISFPCLDVETSGGSERGYAVIRAPFATTHIIVTPTVRTVGIEAERLQAPGAPNYFADAWASRHFAADVLRRRPSDTDLAMAVNSRPGRSQDQLHIHVDCIRQGVARSLAAQMSALHTGMWTRLAVLPRGPRYFATPLDEAEFAGTNIFKLVQTGLNIAPDTMNEVTIIVVGAVVHGAPGFVVLARQRIPGTRDEAHGEALMDHGCSALLSGG